MFFGRSRRLTLLRRSFFGTIPVEYRRTGAISQLDFDASYI
jgi:hypothetical protein